MDRASAPRPIERLRTVREARALSQAELARTSKVARATIVSAEQGKPVHLRTIRKLAAVLRVEPQELVGVASNGAATQARERPP